MRLRQVALVATDLEPVVDELCSRLGLRVCYRDPGVGVFGLRNALLAVGDTFLEVVSPVTEGTAAGRHLARRGGDGGYMVMLQVGDLDAERRRVDRLGVRIVWEGGHDGIRGMHLHPSDIGGAIVSLDQAEPPDSWDWAGAGWRDAAGTDVTDAIDAVELQSDDPERLARRWALVLGGTTTRGDDGVAVIRLDTGTLRFAHAADGRGDGVGGVDLVAADRRRAGERMVIGGVRITLV